MKLFGLGIVSQRELRKTAQATEIPVDARQSFYPLVVQDATHLVPQSHVAQVRGRGESGGRCHAFDGGLLVRKHRRSRPRRSEHL